MVTKGSDEEFFAYIAKYEDEAFGSGSGGQQALETFEHLIERLKQAPIFQHDATSGITTQFPKSGYYFPHRFGSVWRKFVKLQQLHKVFLKTEKNGKEYVQVATASGSICYNHVSIQVYCWYAYDTREVAKKHFRELKKYGHLSPHALLRIPFYVVEGISSILTNDMEELVDFLFDVLLEKK